MDQVLVARNATTVFQGFEGNPDIYGIGIRLGYYTQAFSIWAANFFVPHEARYLHSLNVLFILAMLLAMVYLCATPSQSYAVEIFLLHQISYTIASVGVTPVYKPKWSWSFRHRLARDVVFLTLDLFSLWFWYVGLSPGKLKRTPGPDGTLVWWLNRGDLFGWIRIVNMIIGPPILIVNTLCLVNLLLSKKRERQMGKALSASSGFHEIQQELSKHLRKLKHASFSMLEKQNSLVTAPSSVASPTEEKEMRKYSFSAQSTIVVESPSRTSGSQGGSEKPDNFGKSAYDLTQSVSHLRPGAVIRSGSTPFYVDKLHQAHTFLEEFLATTKHIPTPPSRRKKWLMALFGYLWILTVLPYKLLRESSRLIYGLAAHRVRWNIDLSLCNYIHYLPSHRTHKINTVLAGAWSHPLYHSVDPNLLQLLIKLRLINKPPPPHDRNERMRNAFIALSACVVLIISVELPLWWNHISGVQVFGLVGQLIPFCLGAGGLVKVIFAFFEQNTTHGKRAKKCHCLEADEELEELARLWKEVVDRERRLRGESVVEDEDGKDGACERFRGGGMTYWFRASTGRLKS